MILRLGEKVRFVCGDRNRDLPCDRLVIALALFAVVMRMQDPIDVVDPEAGKVIQDFPRPEIDQDTP